ncbi:MAG: glycosyltransferase [Chitinophagaceae bacterium]
MATIAFMMDIQEGHILPSLGLAVSLKRRGYKVVYISVPDNEQIVIQNGFEFYRLFEDLYPFGFNDVVKNMDQVVELNADKQHLSHISKIIEGALDPFFAHYKPDLFIISAVLKLEILLIHYKYKIDPVIFTPCLPEEGVTLAQRCVSEIMKFPGKNIAELVDFFSNCGVALTSMEKLVEPLLTLSELIACPQDLEIVKSKNKANVCYLAPFVRFQNSERQREVWQKTASGKKIIYASFGTQLPAYGLIVVTFFSKLINVMKSSELQEFHLFLALGGAMDRKNLPENPSNVTVLDWAPQADILQNASLAIIHGGLSTIKECIYCAVPMLVIPLARDQPSNAGRIVHSNLGLSDKVDRISECQLKNHIVSLTHDETIKKKITEMSKIFQKKQREEAGVEFVEKLVNKNNFNTILN